MLQPPSPASFVWFSLICSPGGGLDSGSSDNRCRREQEEDGRKMVWQGPHLGFVAETGKFVAMGDALSTISLLACFCALLPIFLFSFFFSFFSYYFFLHPGLFIFFVSLRLCSSHLLLSASTYFIVRVLSACVICTLPHLGIILFIIRLVFFFEALISRVAFFCCALVPGTLS